MTFANDINLRAVSGRVRAALDRALDEAADVVFDASQREVPVDEGDLKRSGKVERDGTRRRIRYTDDIAIIAHENMAVEHRVGSAKFLEKAMHGKAAEASQAAATTFRRELGT